MIASSHLTSDSRVLKALASINPSAVTLKTTSENFGGKQDEALGKRNQRKVHDGFTTAIGRFTDGPKPLEFWDLATTGLVLNEARTILPTSKLGLSILQGENYEEALNYLTKIGSGLADYIELNLKYSLRSEWMALDRGNSFYDGFSNYLDELVDDVTTFVDTFSMIPKIIKLPRESIPFLQFPQLRHMLEMLFEQNTSIIVANSLRTTIPRTYDNKSDELDHGVLTGKHLFLSTFDAVKHLDLKYREGGFVVASGGIYSVANCLDMFSVGSNAFQLCSVIDDKKPPIVDLLREQLANVLDGQPLGEYAKQVRNNPKFAHDMIVRAKLIISSTRTAIENLFTNPLETMLPHFSQAIHGELDGTIDSVSLPSAEELASLPQTTTLLGRGNMSSYAVQTVCNGHLQGNSYDLVTSGKLLGALSKPEFHYDLCLMPKSLFEAITRQDPVLLGERSPVHLCDCGTSVSELVGFNGSKLGDIRTVYHFNGPTARGALGQLAKHAELDHINNVAIDREHLEALLAFWKPEAAILAKPPISRLYGMLSSSANDWGVLARFEEPIFLVCSQSFSKKVSMAQIETLKNLYAYSALTVAGNVEKHARRSLDEGTITYFAEMFGVALPYLLIPDSQ